MKRGIAIKELEVAAMYFTMSDYCLLHIMDNKFINRNIKQAYSQANEIVSSETGTSLNESKQDWIKLCNKAKHGDYLTAEWEQAKLKYNID